MAAKQPERPKYFLDEQGNVTVDLPYAKERLTLRRPKGKDLKVLDSLSANGEVSIMINLVAQLSGQSVADVENWDAEDLGVAGEALSLFPAFSKRR